MIRLETEVPTNTKLMMVEKEVMETLSGALDAPSV